VAVKDETQDLLSIIANPLNLSVAKRHLAAGPGQAPGPDGLRYGDISESDWFAVLRNVSQALLDERYTPAKPDSVKISKPSGGHRELRLFNIVDRVVLRGIVQATQPYMDQSFGPDCFGSRPKYGSTHAVARLAALVELHQPGFVVVADIQQAFDNVSRPLLAEVIRYRIGDDRFARLVERINAACGDGKGIPQGSPLSPLLLDMLLTNRLHGPWSTRLPGVPLLRNVDDLMAVCTTPAEARQADERLEGLLQNNGFRFKQDGRERIQELRPDNEIKWLGLQVSKAEGRLRVRLSSEWFDDLAGDFDDCHRAPHSHSRAIDVVRGRLDNAGPAYLHEDRHAVLHGLRRVAAQYGFTELPENDELESWWHNGQLRWQKYMSEARRLAVPKRPAFVKG